MDLVFAYAEQCRSVCRVEDDLLGGEETSVKVPCVKYL